MCLRIEWYVYGDVQCYAGEKGFTIMSSTPSVISCDLKLKPGEVKSCECHVTCTLHVYIRTYIWQAVNCNALFKHVHTYLCMYF
jgi:hypothetical protein